MRIEKMINIHFSEADVKQALLAWLEERVSEEYYAHIINNYYHSCLDADEGEFVLIINGAIGEGK